MGDLLIKWFCSKPSDNPLCKTYQSLENEETGAYYNRGVVRIGKDKLLDEAIADYKRAIEINPKNSVSTDELDADMKGSGVEKDELITDEEIRLYTEKLLQKANQLGFPIWEDHSFRRKTQDATNMLKNILGRQGLRRNSDEYKRKLALGLYYLAEMPAKEGLPQKRDKLERIEKALKENGLAEFWNYLKIAGGPTSSQSVEE